VGVPNCLCYISTNRGRCLARNSKRYDQGHIMIESETRQADWRRANPIKYDAHLAVQRALKAGQLERQSCEVCGSDAVDAHHDQYEKPLQVRWLCRRHHTRLHHYGEDMFPVKSLGLDSEN